MLLRRRSWDKVEASEIDRQCCFGLGSSITLLRIQHLRRVDERRHIFQDMYATDGATLPKDYVAFDHKNTEC